MDKSGEIRAFIRRNFFVPEAVVVADHDSLIGLGVVDSTGVLEIMSYIEDAFSIAIDERDMVPENLDSISGMAAFVARKLSSASSLAATDAAEPLAPELAAAI